MTFSQKKTYSTKNPLTFNNGVPQGCVLLLRLGFLQSTDWMNTFGQLLSCCIYSSLESIPRRLLGKMWTLGEAQTLKLSPDV